MINPGTEPQMLQMGAIRPFVVASRYDAVLNISEIWRECRRVAALINCASYSGLPCLCGAPYQVIHCGVSSCNLQASHLVKPFEAG
jgi:hypothetical protein